jgi:hypothetical protein
MLPENLGRVDILIVGPTVVIVIGNKVHAKLGPDQLDRYWQYACARAKSSRLPILVYLTPGGDPPENTNNEIPSLISLSYRYDLYHL